MNMLESYISLILEKTHSKIGVKNKPINIPANSEKVKKLLPNVGEIIWHGKHPKGLPYGEGWYTRKINGIPETKIIIGNPPGIKQ